MKFYIFMIINSLYVNISFAKVKILETIDVYSVISDFPVIFSSLQQKEWQLIGNYNKTQNLTVTSRKITEKNGIIKYYPHKSDGTAIIIPQWLLIVILISMLEEKCTPI